MTERGRGGGWVLGQVLLVAAILLSAALGPGVPGSVAVVAYALGGVLIALGVLLVVAGATALGSSLTPFPGAYDTRCMAAGSSSRWGGRS